MSQGRPAASSHNSSSSQPHQPLQPSTLRQSHTPNSRPGSDDSQLSDTPSASRLPVDHEHVTESTPLIPASAPHEGDCDHGTFSPRAASPHIDSFQSSPRRLGSPRSGDEGIFGSSGSGAEDWKGWLKTRIKTRRMGQSRQLAERAGFDDSALM